MSNLVEKALAQGAKMRRSPIDIPDSNRRDLAGWLAEWGFNSGAEIGTRSGHYADVLVTANPRLALSCVDTWSGRNAKYRRVAERCLRDRARLIHTTSEQAAGQFDDESLDFVYIDAGHDLLNVVRDLVLWTPKVRPGGIIAGHDYKLVQPADNDSGEFTHVVQAVNAYVRAYWIKPWFVLGRTSKTEAAARGEKREKERTFCWERPEVIRG